ncbi:MAG TPA: DUF883 domain-containing protein [Noviherbaspirillum sp.]|nr:DUF883 domain-containing protein [Noviherbaspirillum sp.]
METNGQRGESRDKLIDDLRSVIGDAEHLLRDTGPQVHENYLRARARFESTLGNAATGLVELEEQIAAKARATLENTDRYVQAHPWQSISVGALAGLVAGLWIGRR